ncbi:hypothetical protein TTHERM_00058910 (macronuclear) [Tetrahymena thermophila SB210]|uniref:Uncharacterized protein n=1 Tax=Tetrahymena thermophila (strain SB210) TaxID=312017 RepID=I7MDD5_TETTS|nr:hypothetical protein TTHERM_00058910 [Tetrahymena thermophila SB210]EAR87379.1 hypothetical protein TTHERM_00058910 [Tetrahymena thermophila SB210]|eukprot:XP_001007624.1 hypothetical protein TTHERM_00058910 [Tetrahymena thermophila SB210]
MTPHSGVYQPKPQQKYNCQTHLGFIKVSSLMKSLTQADVKASVATDNIISQFKKAKPQQIRSHKLGVCRQFADQNTCCNSNIVSFIDQLALYKVQSIQKEKSAFQKLISVYIKQLNLNCNSKVIIHTTYEQILNNSNLTSFQETRKNQKECKISFSKAISAYTRGVMCSICVGVEKIGSYFNSEGQMIISSQSQLMYSKATDDAINCFSNILSASNLDKIINEFNLNYIKDNDQCGILVKKNVLSIFANHSVQNNDGKGNKLCKGTRIFSDNSACENVLLGSRDLETKERLLRSESNQTERILQTIEDVILKPNGMNIYIPSSIDVTIDEDGKSISVDFSNFSSSTNKSQIITSISLMAILIYFL